MYSPVSWIFRGFRLDGPVFRQFSELVSIFKGFGRQIRCRFSVKVTLIKITKHGTFPQVH